MSANLSDLTNRTEAIDNLSQRGAAKASATTTDLSTSTGDFVHITGTTTITGFGTAAAGVERTITFDGALTLTHNATSLILPGGANITTAANDSAVMRSEGSGNWRCISYSRATGKAVVAEVTLAGSETLTNKTLTQPILTLEQGTSVAPTAEGRIAWDTDDDKLKVGAGSSVTKTFTPDGDNSLYSAKSADYNVVAGDRGTLFGVNASGAARTVSPLSAATAGVGFRFGVKKTDSSANPVTIDFSGSETGDGATTYVLYFQYHTVWFRSDGTNWVVEQTHLPDVVVTNANGTYVKRADGTMTCRKTVSGLGPASTTVNSGAFFRTANFSAGSWAATFVGDLPEVTASAGKATSTAAAWPMGWSGASLSSAGDWALGRTATSSDTDFILYLVAEGRWRT